MGTIQGKDLERIFISIVYSPPDVPFKKTCESLVDNFKLHSDNYNNSIILGDININLLSTPSEATFLLDLASKLGLKVVEHGPTHFATNTGT